MLCNQQTNQPDAAYKWYKQPSASNGQHKITNKQKTQCYNEWNGRTKKIENMLRWQKRKPIRHWDDSKFRRTTTIKNTHTHNVQEAHLYHFVSGDKLLWLLILFSSFKDFFFIFLMNAKRIAILNERFFFFFPLVRSIDRSIVCSFFHFVKKKSRQIKKWIVYTSNQPIEFCVFGYVHTKSMNWWCSPMFAFCRT